QLQAEANAVKDQGKPSPIVEASAKPATQQAQNDISAEKKEAQPVPITTSDGEQEGKQTAGVQNVEGTANAAVNTTKALQPKVVSAVAATDEGIEITIQ